MKHGNEIVDGRRLLRAICGVMAMVSLLIGVIGAVKHGLAQDWLEVLERLPLLFSAWLFGHFAATGRLPLKRDRDGKLVRDRNRDST